MIYTRVSLSSGEFFYVDADLEELEGYLTWELVGEDDHDPWERRDPFRRVRIGSRLVNPAQVAQITREEMSTIHTPERLEAADGAVR